MLAARKTQRSKWGLRARVGESDSSSESAAGPLLGRRRLLVLLGGAGLIRCGVDDRSEAMESVRQGLGVIEGGVDVDNQPTLNAALDEYAPDGAAPHGPVTIIIDHPIRLDATVTIAAHVTLRFQDNGQIKLNGHGLILDGPIEAPTNPPQPLFDVSGGTNAAPRHAGTTYHPNWWSDDAGGASDIGQQWNNMVRSMQTGNDEVAPRKFRLLGEHDSHTMMDFRDLRGQQSIDFTGSLIKVSGLSGGVAINFTNAAVLTVRGLRVECTDGSAQVGVLLSRSRHVLNNGNVASSDKFRFYDLQILGKWQIAALYTIATESNIFVGGRWENTLDTGLFTAYFGHHMFSSLETELPEYHTFGLPQSGSLPYDGSTNEDGSSDQPPPTEECGVEPFKCCAPGQTVGCFNPPDATTNGNELFGVTIASKAIRGALYIRGAGDFSLHDARIQSSTAPYVVMHAAEYQRSATDPPCCLHQENLGPLVIRNLVGVGWVTKPLVAVQTIGQLPDQPDPGEGRASVEVYLNAKTLETKADPNACELQIGRNFLAGRVVLPGQAGVRSDSGAVVAADIELRGIFDVPVKLGNAAGFAARLKAGNLSELEMPIAAAPVASGIVRSFHPSSPRTRHYSPLAIVQRDGAPATSNEEAVLWLEQGQLKLKIKHNGQETVATLGVNPLQGEPAAC
jgi:hypothetical protein